MIMIIIIVVIVIVMIIIVIVIVIVIITRGRHPFVHRRRFSGFRSRWMMFLPWMWANAAPFAFVLFLANGLLLIMRTNPRAPAPRAKEPLRVQYDKRKGRGEN